MFGWKLSICTVKWWFWWDHDDKPMVSSLHDFQTKPNTTSQKLRFVPETWQWNRTPKHVDDVGRVFRHRTLSPSLGFGQTTWKIIGLGIWRQDACFIFQWTMVASCIASAKKIEPSKSYWKSATPLILYLEGLPRIVDHRSIQFFGVWKFLCHFFEEKDTRLLADKKRQKTCGTSRK